MAMLRQVPARAKDFVNFFLLCTRNCFTSKKTFNDIPSPHGMLPLIGHAHLFGPTGLMKLLLKLRASERNL
jgi:hypothetical protein